MPDRNLAVSGQNLAGTAHPSRQISLHIGDGRGRPPVAIGRLLSVVETLNARGIAPTLADLRTLAPDTNWESMRSKIAALRSAGLLAYVPSTAPPFHCAYVVCLYLDDFKIKKGADHVQRLAKFHELIRRYQKAAR